MAFFGDFWANLKFANLHDARLKRTVAGARREDLKIGWAQNLRQNTTKLRVRRFETLFLHSKPQCHFSSFRRVLKSKKKDATENKMSQRLSKNEGEVKKKRINVKYCTPTHPDFGSWEKIPVLTLNPSKVILREPDAYVVCED